MENKYFKNFCMQNFQHIINLRINRIRTVNISLMNSMIICLRITMKSVFTQKKLNLLFQKKLCYVPKYGQSFNVPCQVNLYHQNNFLIRCYFCFIRSDMKRNCYQIVHHFIKTNCKRKDLRML